MSESYLAYEPYLAFSYAFVLGLSGFLSGLSGLSGLSKKRRPLILFSFKELGSILFGLLPLEE